MAGIYITSLEGGSGQTAVAASLASLLAEQGKRAGYFKPVTLVTDSEAGGLPDPDAVFCREALGLTESVDEIAPNAATAEAVRDQLAGKMSALRRSLSEQWQGLSSGKDVVLIDGIPAAGEIADASQALAELTDSQVVAVVRFHREMDLDAVAGLKERFGDRLAGVILNATPPQSLRVARSEATPALEERGVKVLGVVPEERRLLSFTVAEYSQRLGGRLLNAESSASEIVESLLVGAMVLDSSEHYYERKQNMALITRTDRPDLQWNAIDASTRCLILTGGGEPIPYVMDKAADAGVPVMVVPQGTLETVSGIEEFVVGPTFHHVEKLACYKALLREHVDLTGFGL